MEHAAGRYTADAEEKLSLDRCFAFKLEPLGDKGVWAGALIVEKDGLK
jgi:hypothetical protein